MAAGRPSWIFDRNDFVYFYLQVTPMLSTELQVSWPFGSGKEAKNRFLRWPPRRQSWISDRIEFNYSSSTSHPDASYQVSSQLAFRFRRRNEKYIYKMATMAAIFNFRSERFYLVLIYKSSPLLPTKFQVNWHFSSGVEAKNRF